MEWCQCCHSQCNGWLLNGDTSQYIIHVSPSGLSLILTEKGLLSLSISLSLFCVSPRANPKVCHSEQIRINLPYTTLKVSLGGDEFRREASKCLLELCF